MLKSLLKNKRLLGFYTIWFTIHFIILVVSWTQTDLFLERGSKGEFWPLTDHNILSTYDFTEFLIYTITPVLIIVAITLINTKQDEE